MQTRLSAFCGRVMEAGVLAALVVAPLYYIIIALHPFDPGKSTMLQAIALVVLVVWVVKTVEERAPAADSFDPSRPVTLSLGFLSQPVLTAGLLLTGAYLLSTLLSVDHGISLWGSFYRRQGIYTLLAYSILFFAAASVLRTRERRERALSVALLASLPVAVYAVVQHFGLDFLPWGEQVEERAAAFIGNPIFLGAFLILVVPPTLTRLGEAMRRLRQPAERLPGLVTVLYYGLFLSALLGAIVFTQSKLAVAGLVAGLFFLGLLWAATHGHRTLFLVILLATALTAVAIVLLILPGTSLGVLQELPMLKRLTAALESRSFITRSLIWDAVTRMIASHPLRLLVGYGPENLDIALQAFFTPELLRYGTATTVLDRAHSDLLDAAATAGLLGLAAYMLLFWALFARVLRGLGLLVTSGEGRLLAALWFGGGLAAALAVRLLEGSLRFTGLGLGLGAMSGLFAYVAYRGLRGRVAGESAHAADSETYLRLGLGAAMLAYFVGGQFGIGTPADRAFFWIFAALIAAVPAGAAQPETARPESAGQQASGLKPGPRSEGRYSAAHSSLRQAAIAGSLMGLILMTLLNDFVWRSTGLKPAPVMLGLLAAVWLAGGIVLLRPSPAAAPAASRTRLPRTAAVYVLTSLPLPLTFLPLHLSTLTPGRVPEVQPILYLAGLVAGICLLALAIDSPGSPASTTWRPGWAGLYLLVAGLAVAAIVVAEVTPLRAVAFDKFGWSATRGVPRPERAMAMYSRAIELTPQWEQFYLRLGALQQEQAERSPAGPQREAYYAAATQTLEAARRLRPANAVHWINLGRLYLRRGNFTSEPTMRQELVKQALEFYEQAASLRPQAPDIYREWGEAYAVLGRRDRAREKFTQAIALDPTYVAGLSSLGQLYQIEGDWAGAVRTYGELARLQPESVNAHRALAEAHWQAGDPQSALVVLLQILELDPRDYTTHRQLIDVYLRLGRPAAALAEARIARTLAPPEEQSALDDIIARLQSQGG